MFKVKPFEPFLEGEPVAQMGVLYGKLYYYMAKALVDNFGEEGERALREAIRDFALDRGETMRAQAEAMGLPLDWQTFSRDGLGDMPDTQPGFKKYHPECKGTKPSEGLCTYAEVWRNYPDGWDLGRIYCDEFHHSKWAAFNPKFRVDMTEVITKGDPICTLVSYEEGSEYDERRKASIREIASKAKKYGYLTDSSSYGDLAENTKEVPVHEEDLKEQRSLKPTETRL